MTKGRSLSARPIATLSWLILITVALNGPPALTQGPRDPSSSALFLPAVTYPSGGVAPYWVAVADFNGDGKLDFAAANFQSGTIGVSLGNGDGTFQNVVSYPSGPAPFSIAAGDLNGDGKPDLIVANAGNSTVGVLLGNGNGTFRPIVNYWAGAASPLAIAIADVNQDGKPDVLALDCGMFTGCGGGSNGAAAILLGTGDGGLHTAAVYDAGAGAYGLAVADLNGDGNLDLAVADCGANVFCPAGSPGSLTILLGNGDGTFQQALSYDAGGRSTMAIGIADVNGDGKLDLVAANYFDDTVSLLLGNGDGTFRSPVTYSTGSNPVAIAVADVDSDGKLDLLSANYGSDTVSLLLGNGDGTFKPAIAFGSGGHGPNSIAMADVDGDGKLDLLVANIYNNDVGVLLNNIAKGKSVTVTSLGSSLNPSIYGQKVTLMAQVITTGPVPPTGTVAFRWTFLSQTYTIGTATLNSAGVATLTKSNLNANVNPRAYPMTAAYRGDTNNPSSTSTVLYQTVLPTTSRATITSSLNPSAVGQAVMFTAKITSPTVMPTGPVTFTLGQTTLSTSQLSGGKATFTTSSLPAGSNVITVTYNGNSNIARSSAAVTQVVHP